MQAQAFDRDEFPRGGYFASTRATCHWVKANATAQRTAISATTRSAISNLAALDLDRELVDFLLDFFELRIDFQHAPEDPQGLRLLLVALEDRADADKRREVARFELQHVSQILHRAG